MSRTIPLKRCRFLRLNLVGIDGLKFESAASPFSNREGSEIRIAVMTTKRMRGEAVISSSYTHASDPWSTQLRAKPVRPRRIQNPSLQPNRTFKLADPKPDFFIQQNSNTITFRTTDRLLSHMRHIFVPFLVRAVDRYCMPPLSLRCGFGVLRRSKESVCS